MMDSEEIIKLIHSDLLDVAIVEVEKEIFERADNEMFLDLIGTSFIDLKFDLLKAINSYWLGLEEKEKVVSLFYSYEGDSSITIAVHKTEIDEEAEDILDKDNVITNSENEVYKFFFIENETAAAILKDREDIIHEVELRKIAEYATFPHFEQKDFVPALIKKYGREYWHNYVDAKLLLELKALQLFRETIKEGVVNELDWAKLPFYTILFVNMEFLMFFKTVKV